MLHSPRRGDQLSYHKPANHWWSWHLINIFIPLSIRNFLSIHQLNYGQTSSHNSYFWLRQSRFLPLPATQWRALGHKPTKPTPITDRAYAQPGVSLTRGTHGATSTCTTQGVHSGRGVAPGFEPVTISILLTRWGWGTLQTVKISLMTMEVVIYIVAWILTGCTSYWMAYLKITRGNVVLVCWKIFMALKRVWIC